MTFLSVKRKYSSAAASATAAASSQYKSLGGWAPENIRKLFFPTPILVVVLALPFRIRYKSFFSLYMPKKKRGLVVKPSICTPQYIYTITIASCSSSSSNGI